nr:hypothetical protein [Dietzia sp. oral taxon 368]
MPPHELAGATAAEFYDWRMVATMQDLIDERAEAMKEARSG